MRHFTFYPLTSGKYFVKICTAKNDAITMWYIVILLCAGMSAP